MADLTTRCGFPLYPNEHPHDDHIPVLEPTHSLRYLHVVATADQLALHNPEDFFENGIPHFAPSLTHLRLSQLNQDEAVITHLESALGLMVPNSSPRITKLPSTVELVLIKPAVAPPPSEEFDYESHGCSCCFDSDDAERYNTLVEYARRLRDKNHRVSPAGGFRSPCGRSILPRMDGQGQWSGLSLGHK